MTVEMSQFLEHKHNGIDGTAVIRRTSFINVFIPGVTSAIADNYGVVFISPRNCVVKDFYETHSVAGTDAGAVTLQLERLQGTEALDSGDELLSTAINLKGAVNTVSRGIITKGYEPGLKIGDRLALKDAGTLTDLAGVCVTIVIEYDYA